MNNALVQAITDTTSELRTIETTLPRVEQLLTNLQRYKTYIRSRQQVARQVYNHLNAVRDVIATIFPRHIHLQPDASRLPSRQQRGHLRTTLTPTHQ